jgi:hypothetical protein
MDMKFEKPRDTKECDQFFPANIMHLLPEYKDIPEEFHMCTGTNPFLKLQSKWFFEGIKLEDFPPVKTGIDFKLAIRHLTAIQRSWEPQHEHKCAAVAYLMSLWFETPK